MSMRADVVISTLNNISMKGFSLQYTIRSLLSQTVADLNILVADNGSEDDTKSSLRREFGNRINVLDTGEKRHNISASRNQAAACGQSEAIFFVDDDMVLSSPTTLEIAIKVSTAVDFTCGAIRRWAPLSWPELIRPDDPIRKIVSTLEHTSYEPLSINRISGKNILDNRSYIGNFGYVKRSAFEYMQGYDENYTAWGYQDTDLMWRMCVSGFQYDLFSRHNIMVYHLSHQVNKGSQYENNRIRFMNKQKEDGRLFRTNHFFEIYENDGYSLFSDFPADIIE
jgi:glycosyltransferase involved in cell wall biosynthesis